MSEQELLDKCRAMVQTDDDLRGHLTVEFCADGKPILAGDFAHLLKHTAKLLEACDETKKIKWAVIEANVIGDIASFTLKGYGKELFKKESVRKKAE